MRQEKPVDSGCADILILCHERQRAGAWRQHLDKDGRHRVLAVGSSAAEALTLIGRHDPDVLLCALQLSDGPTLHLVRRLRASGAHAHRMILLISPSADDPELLEAMRSGADSYYVTHGPGPALARRVDQMLQGESKMSALMARRVLEHFDRPGAGAGADPLGLTPQERALLLRVAQGQTVPEVASAERLSMHQVAKSLRSVHRKMTWDLRTAGLALA